MKKKNDFHHSPVKNLQSLNMFSEIKSEHFRCHNFCQAFWSIQTQNDNNNFYTVYRHLTIVRLLSSLITKMIKLLLFYNSIDC